MGLKNFRKLKDHVDVLPIATELAAQPEAWSAQTGRQRVRVQREALAIPIRGLRKSKLAGGRNRRDVHESRYTTLSRSFPAVTSFIEAIARELDATLARAKIVNLPPGARVHAHVDRGEYYARRDRYHLVVESAGCPMRAGDETVVMRTGELWWFDNKTDHEAWNDSDSPRIHLIFDLEPGRSKARPRRRPRAQGPAPTDELAANGTAAD